MKIKDSTPALPPSIETKQAPPAPISEFPCSVEQVGDALSVRFTITDPTAVRRLKNKAQSVPMERYIWDNIIRRAVEGHVY